MGTGGKSPLSITGAAPTEGSPDKVGKMCFSNSSSSSSSKSSDPLEEEVGFPSDTLRAEDDSGCKGGRGGGGGVC